MKKSHQRLPQGYAKVKAKRVSGVRNNMDRTDKKTTHITIAGVKAQGRKLLEEKLGWYSVQLFHCKTKTDRRKMMRKIAEVKKELKKFEA